MQRKDSIVVHAKPNMHASIIQNCISAQNRHCWQAKRRSYWQEREANVMKGLIHGLMHSVRQLCGDAMNILKASPKQYELPAISEERKLQTVALEINSRILLNHGNITEVIWPKLLSGNSYISKLVR